MPLKAFNVAARDVVIEFKGSSIGGPGITATEAKQDVQITELQGIKATFESILGVLDDREVLVNDVIYSDDIIPMPNDCVAFSARALEQQDIVVQGVNAPWYVPVQSVVNSDSNSIVPFDIDLNGGAGIVEFVRRPDLTRPPIFLSGVYKTVASIVTIRLQFATAGDVFIDWGDGSTETVAFNAGVLFDVSHTYASDGNYFANFYSDESTNLEFVINLTQSPVWQKLETPTMAPVGRISWSNNLFYKKFAIPNAVNLDTIFLGGADIEEVVTSNRSQDLRVISLSGTKMGLTLKPLNLSNRSALQTIQVQNTLYQEIDYTASTNLVFFIVPNNNLYQTLNFTGYNSLEWIYIYGNENQDNLTGLAGKVSLTRVLANSCDLATLNVSNCTNLETLVLNTNPQLVTVNITSCQSLVTLDVSSCPLISVTGLSSSLDYELIDFRNCGLDNTEMNSILTAIDSNTGSYTAPVRQLLLENNVVPDAANLLIIADLVTDGWTVTHDV